MLSLPIGFNIVSCLCSRAVSAADWSTAGAAVGSARVFLSDCDC